MNFKHFVLAAFLGLIALAAIAWMSHTSTSGLDPEYEFEGEVVKVFSSPEELVETYKKDQKAADAKYYDNGVQVSAEISGLGEISESDIHPLKLITGDARYVQCYFPKKKHAEILMKLKMSPMAIIVGRCKGMESNGLVVTLDGCRIEMPGRPQMPFGHP